MNVPSGQRGERDIRLLIGGAFVGATIAAFGVLKGSEQRESLPAAIVAEVNGVAISSDAYQRSLRRQQLDSEHPLGTADEAWVLERLIDEELLVQRGLALGMAQAENEVRGAIVRSLIASVTAEADAAEPTDTELRDWFANNVDRFTYSSDLAVRAWSTTEQHTANEFAEALRADGSLSAPATLQAIVGLPNELLPAAKLRDYLGNGITAALMRLPAGLVSVYAQQGRWLVVQLVDKRSASVADFDQIKMQILTEYRRDLADRHLRDYIHELRQRASIVVNAQ